MRTRGDGDGDRDGGRDRSDAVLTLGNGPPRVISLGVHTVDEYWVPAWY